MQIVKVNISTSVYYRKEFTMVDMAKVDARLAALRAERQKTGRLDANESYEYAKCLQLKQQHQKQQLDDKIQQEMFAKKNEAPKPQTEVAAKTPEDILKEKATKGFSLLPKPEELDFSKPIQGLSIEKTNKPDNAES